MPTNKIQESSKMENVFATPAKAPKRVQKHARLSQFFNGDSTVSTWFFGPAESARNSPRNDRVCPSADQQYSFNPSIPYPIEPAPIIPHESETERADNESEGSSWRDIERRVALPFPWIRGRFAVTQDEVPSRSLRRSRAWAWIRPKRSGARSASRTCFPSVGDDRIRHNTVGCLISGILLIIMLMTCSSSCTSEERLRVKLTWKTDLALAVSKTIRGQPLHIVMIVIILIMTVVFCQYLIHVCMLAVRAKSPPRGDDTAFQRGRCGSATTRNPSRVFLARDGEYRMSNESRREVLQAPGTISPPPAYGAWRGSVVSTFSSIV